jgi:uncharacterized membrane-anchored protein
MSQGRHWRLLRRHDAAVRRSDGLRVLPLVSQRGHALDPQHRITTRRREQFYWCAVLATFALGTAAGDLTAISLNLGFFASIALFGVAILVPGLLWWRGRINPIVAFWSAYVITRPLGASIVDWLGKPAGQTGVGLGDGTVSGLALILFIALVAYVAVTKNDIQQPHSVRSHRRAAGLVAQPAES